LLVNEFEEMIGFEILLRRKLDCARDFVGVSLVDAKEIGNHSIQPLSSTEAEADLFKQPPATILVLAKKEQLVESRRR
jgi:hypothetical protein